MLDYRIFTFIKVCQTLNFTQAARELHITHRLSKLHQIARVAFFP